ncbi:TPR-like protein [Pisolithus albus]|nr:TPR-like protein [Pisolithus albus]
MLPTSVRASRASLLRFRSDAQHLLTSRAGRLGVLHTKSVSRLLPVDIRLGRIPCHRHLAKRWATSTTPHSTASDPADIEAMRCLEQGTQKLEENDLQGAKELYRRSVEIKRNASSLFNLGVTHYHLSTSLFPIYEKNIQAMPISYSLVEEFDEAIAAWKESIELQPDSPDVHTSKHSSVVTSRCADMTRNPSHISDLASAYIISPVSRPDLALHHLHIAASLAPEDPEIAFNLAAVLEATGQLEEALNYYKRAEDNGVERAAMHIRNVSAKILGKTFKAAQEADRQGSPDIPRKPGS